jgi:NADH-quinone oxidoreductase subunit C
MSDETVESEVPAPPEPERSHGALVTRSRGQMVLHPTRDEYVALASALKADGYVTLIDVTAVDYSAAEALRDLPDAVAAERYEVVTSLLSHRARTRVRLRVQVPADAPTVPSLFDLYPGAEALEREVYDMFGIEFSGHPDLTRILMPEDWIGYPLRKDYAVGRIPVQFKGAPAKR